MSNTTYNSGNMTITLEGLDEVEKALGDLSQKTPATAKVAINAAAREARKLMVARAKSRYAVNAAGQRHLKELAQSKKATNGSLSAELHISSYRNDLGYFESSPSTPLMGRDALRGPAYFTARVLRASAMKPLTGTGSLSKGFLVRFKSGHIGMVQRVKKSRARSDRTERGFPRWEPNEKLQTMGSPSATAMHNTIWPEVQPDVEQYLLARLDMQVQKVLEQARRSK